MNGPQGVSLWCSRAAATCAGEGRRTDRSWSPQRATPKAEKIAGAKAPEGSRQADRRRRGQPVPEPPEGRVIHEFLRLRIQVSLVSKSPRREGAGPPTEDGRRAGIRPPNPNRDRAKARAGVRRHASRLGEGKRVWSMGLSETSIGAQAPSSFCAGEGLHKNCGIEPIFLFGE